MPHSRLTYLYIQCMYTYTNAQGVTFTRLYFYWTERREQSDDLSNKGLPESVRGKGLEQQSTTEGARPLHAGAVQMVSIVHDG